MKTWKTRHQFYLPDELSAKLDALAAKPGASKTAILSDALGAWLERQGAREVDARFGPRLDRQLRQLQRIDETLQLVSEMLDLFVAHQLTLVAHHPPFDAATAQLGIQRYRQFLDQVSRRLAKKGRHPEPPNDAVTDGADDSGA